MDSAEIDAVMAIMAMQDAGQRIRLEMDAVTLFTIVGQLQLALRHPNNPDGVRRVTCGAIDAITAALPPAVRPIIERGHLAAYDH